MKILVVDDNVAICQALTLMLELQGYHVVCAHNAVDALQIVERQAIALVIQDMNFSQALTSGEEGKNLFYQIKAAQPLLPVILLTAWSQLSMAVELVKAGAADYLEKPWNDAQLLDKVTDAISSSTVTNHASRDKLCGLVYRSEAMQSLVDMALQVAASEATVLITGDNGSGKEKVAEIIQANSKRLNKPFIKVNLAALPHDLLEAELFGAEAGAFTGNTKLRLGRFEAADGGTLFLDEIGELPLASQVKLLRVIQTGEFQRLGSHQTLTTDVRLISATNADLAALVKAGRFREDLYYRLNVIELAVLPLASRKADILLLAEHFLGSQPLKPLSESCQRAMLDYHWPGNVRQLQNACMRAKLLSQTQHYQWSDFGIEAPLTTTKNELNDPSKEAILAALSAHKGVIAHAAKALGLSRQSLYRRLQRYQLDHNDFAE